MDRGPGFRIWSVNFFGKFFLKWLPDEAFETTLETLFNIGIYPPRPDRRQDYVNNLHLAVKNRK